MKQHFERYWIYYLIGLIFLIGIVVCFAIYKPAVGSELSNNNADWGNFGAFFWGLGTMCFTLFNVIVFYHIEQRLYRKQFFDTYRVVIEKIIHNIKDQEQLKLDLIDMIGVLAGINNVSAYNECVKNQADNLVTKIQNYSANKNNEELAKLVGELTAFQLCLISNEHHEGKGTNEIPKQKDGLKEDQNA